MYVGVGCSRSSSIDGIISSLSCYIPPHYHTSSCDVVIALTHMYMLTIHNSSYIITSPFNLSMYVAIIEACSVNRIIFSSFIFNSFFKARICVSTGMSLTTPSYKIYNSTKVVWKNTHQKFWRGDLIFPTSADSTFPTTPIPYCPYTTRHCQSRRSFFGNINVDILSYFPFCDITQHLFATRLNCLISPFVVPK